MRRGRLCKSGTAEFYRDILDRIVKPEMGTAKADKLTRLQVGKLHSSLADTPFQANRMLAVVGSMYAFAGRAGRRRLPRAIHILTTILSVARRKQSPLKLRQL
jgi:hypothetical protein